MNHQVLRDGVLLLLRLALGVIAIAHGWNRVFQQGMDGGTGTIELFRAAGAPAPGVLAWLTAGVEMLGGAMVVAGLLTTAAAGALALVTAVSFYFFHMSNGFFAVNNGMELPLLIIVCCLTIVVFGAGRASLDRALSRFA
ncbi:DoxX family protein [Corynebacterium suicordis]|uniref:DoxX family protein n=1 Tax=Corynebacterium suicordis DSM 45110 TaxID=1121369 RepID=A0ABR9ZIB0_9CORY|nr:DoxX family protein [Corynebacterium suicordis]MBF4553102.1 DoxX family protein [Corynebacterium suicordis DSM 45110]MDR6277935.1 putative oxidoreductase [Corynebacterium suicordis]